MGFNKRNGVDINRKADRVMGNQTNNDGNDNVSTRGRVTVVQPNGERVAGVVQNGGGSGNSSVVVCDGRTCQRYDVSDRGKGSPSQVQVVHDGGRSADAAAIASGGKVVRTLRGLRR